MNIMSVLSGQSILNEVKSGALSIHGFDPQGIQPATYDMKLHWKILISPTRHESGRLVDLRKEPENEFYIDPGRFVGVLTKEILRLPLTISGRFGLKSEFTRCGLMAFGGIQVDPGFHGRLAISLFHAGPEPIKLKLDARMFTVEFNTLDAPAKPYEGEFQNQRDFPSSQRKFILNAHTVSLAEINSLPSELEDIRRRLTVSEAVIHIVKRDLTVNELALAQGIKPIRNPKKLMGGWPSDDKDFDSFLTTLKSWRAATS